MSKQEYENLKPELDKLQAKQIIEPPIPVAIALQEAENLYVWSQDDRDELIRAGIDWNLVTNLPQRCAACRFTQSEWNKEYKGQENAQKKWKIEYPKAVELHNLLLHHFYYAFRNHPELITKTKKIAKGTTVAKIIQNLNDLSILGKANIALLEKINVPIQLLDQATQTSEETAKLFATINNIRKGGSENKQNRDRAYSYLKQAVDEIRRTGQYIFYRNDERKKGYISSYYHQYRTNHKSDKQD